MPAEIVVLVGWQTDHGKPAPDLFLYAVEHMGAKLQACVIMEDSTASVHAGLAAGMRVLGFAGGSHANVEYEAIPRRAGAETVFADMSDLPRLLDRQDNAREYD